MKECSVCGETKSLDDFVKDRNRKGGRCASCLSCSREKWRKLSLSRTVDPEDLPGEKWLPVRDFDGYEVSDSGRIKTFRRRFRGKIMRDHPANGGYRSVNLKTEGSKTKHMLVHRLVAKAFIPNPDGKPQVNHKDGDKLNNTLSNLEWATAQENAKHAWRTGLVTPNGRKLSDNQVREIRQRYKNYDSNNSAPAIGKEYGVSSTVIYYVVHRRHYNGVSDEE